jgi:uncharacterized protein (TIGR02145 family)
MKKSIISIIIVFVILPFFSCNTNEDFDFSFTKSSEEWEAFYGGLFIDDRDNQTYKWVKIGEQTWMAKNLNYKPRLGNSWCYDNNAANCDVYGRLYDLETANIACPSGWHLPNIDEWNALLNYADDNVGYLMAANGWNNCHRYNHSDVSRYYLCTDIYGFSALPGGHRNEAGDFSGAAIRGIWWVVNYNDFFDNCWYVGTDTCPKEYKESNGFSVRCLKDVP